MANARRMRSSSRSLDELHETAWRLSRKIIEITTEAGSSHPSSSLSAIDVLVALYFGGILRYDPEVTLVDARSPEECSGEVKLADQGGHIPGAVNLVWLDALDGGDAVTIVAADWQSPWMT